MRIFAGVALAFTLLTTMAHAQPRAPGCLAPVAPELIGDASQLDYLLTDTAGLNVVLVHIIGQTTLSDTSCRPDPEQGALQVVTTYGSGSEASPEENAREMVWGVHARTRRDRRPIDFPPIAVEAHSVNGMSGAEAISQDVTANGVSVFRYALVFVFPDGAKGLMSASGPADRLDALRPSFRRIAAGLRPRRDVRGMQEDLVASLDNMLERIRGPIVDQALDACLVGAFTRDAAIARAQASGFPAFQSEPPSSNGEQWYRSAAPENDSGRITLGVLQASSRMMPRGQALTCVIMAPPGMATLLRQRFQTRFQSTESQLIFTIADGVVTPAGGAAQVQRGGGIGRANFASEERMATITIEITPLN